jgi:hypothetical protein
VRRQIGIPAAQLGRGLEAVRAFMTDVAGRLD